MKRSSAIGAAVAAALLLLAAAANAGSQTSAPTLSFLDATSQGSQHFLDNAPKSPTGNPRSQRFRLSTGDELYTLSPILDKTGKRIGTSYSQFTVLSGNSFGNAWFKGHGVFRLHDGQIVVDGITKAASTINTVAVVGGTGAYKGARGSMTFTETTNGSQDLIHLLP